MTAVTPVGGIRNIETTVIISIIITFIFKIIIGVCIPGWVSVCAGEGMDVSLRAYTPSGEGCVVRTPALLMYAVNQRGKRKRGKAAYQVRSLQANNPTKYI